jgi:hypothetical protein
METSAGIGVKALSTIFLWPLTLDLDPNSRQDDLSAKIDDQIRRLLDTKLWEHVPPWSPNRLSADRPRRRMSVVDFRLPFGPCQL